MSKRHKAFISYHHQNDENYKNIFELRFGNKFDILIPGGVSVGDINPNLPTETIRQKIRDEYLRDTSVTVVLIGQETWKRKHVDWEISSSIRNTELNPRSGLLGLVLPSYYQANGNKVNQYTIPPRLWKNLECGFAILKNWSNEPEDIQSWVHEAYLKKSRINPDNSFPLFKNNRSGSAWQE